MIEGILKKLKDTEGVLAIILTNKEGSLLYSISNLDISLEILSGLTASLAGLSDEILQELKMGKLKNIILNGTIGRLIISSLNNENILFVSVENTGNIELIESVLLNTIEDLNKTNY
ncbi:MAG: roadblock/LC7 domain-containing protein [Caldisericaceae bacterium]|nr:roadblock/LC7 domain-containing protein [Caldisericaceae bacterium]